MPQCHVIIIINSLSQKLNLYKYKTKKTLEKENPCSKWITTDGIIKREILCVKSFEILKEMWQGQRNVVRLEFPPTLANEVIKMIYHQCFVFFCFFSNPYVSVCHLFAVIHTGDGDFALADEVVLVDVVHQATVGYNFYMEYMEGLSR